jgi:two-component system chemotaxis response regulator CheB
MMPFQMIAVGTSLGGFEALKTILGSLPEDFPAAVAVVQHRSGEDSEGMLRLMQPYVRLPLVEVEDKDQIKGGYVYLSPQLSSRCRARLFRAFSRFAGTCCAAPSIDVSVRIGGRVFGEHAIGVLLTGMSRDGTAGLAKIKERGGFAVVQDPPLQKGRRCLSPP